MPTQTSISSSKKVEVTITLPSVNLSVLINRAKLLASTILSSVYNPISSNISKASMGASTRARRMRLPRMGGFNFDKSKIKFIFPIVIGIIVIAALVTIVRSLPDAKSRPAEQNTASQGVVSTIKLDKKFVFPLKDDKGKEVGTFDYLIQSADLQKQIIVKGQRASAIEGRVFLILNLKITNNLKQAIQLNTRDYLRLIVTSNKDEQLALDIHNDPVEVQAISTKYTRVGIALNESDAKKLIQLKVGEIDGEKQTVELNFKY